MARSPKDKKSMKNTINELKVLIGEDGVGDAIGVIAFFAFITRVVAGTGHDHPIIKVVSKCHSYGCTCKLLLISLVVLLIAILSWFLKFPFGFL